MHVSITTLFSLALFVYPFPNYDQHLVDNFYTFLKWVLYSLPHFQWKTIRQKLAFVAWAGICLTEWQMFGRNVSKIDRSDSAILHAWKPATARFDCVISLEETTTGQLNEPCMKCLIHAVMLSTQAVDCTKGVISCVFQGREKMSAKRKKSEERVTPARLTASDSRFALIICTRLENAKTDACSAGYPSSWKLSRWKFLTVRSTDAAGVFSFLDCNLHFTSTVEKR